jgi:hypothetical protein
MQKQAGAATAWTPPQFISTGTGRMAGCRRVDVQPGEVEEPGGDLE